MIRPLAFSFAVAVLLLTAPACRADETFPVVHNEPITVRILNGRDGQPVAHRHLLLIAGYDQSDIHEQVWREETLSDAQGRARLSGQMSNLPWIQVWVDKTPLCQAHPRSAGFSVERIRRDGLSTPNRCGAVIVEDAPGVFTVFVDNKAGNLLGELRIVSEKALNSEPKAIQPAASSVTAASPGAAATEAEELQTVVQPVQRPDDAILQPFIQTHSDVDLAAALPIAPDWLPMETAIHLDLPEFAATPAPVVLLAADSARIPVKAAPYCPLRRVAARQASRRARPAVHRARPISDACHSQMRQPPARAAATSLRRRGRSPSSAAPIKAIATSGKAKPAAGVKLAAVPSAAPIAPRKEE